MKICYSLIAYYMDFMVHYPFYIDVLVYLDLSLVCFVSSYFSSFSSFLLFSKYFQFNDETCNTCLTLCRLSKGLVKRVKDLGNKSVNKLRKSGGEIWFVYNF